MPVQPGWLHPPASLRIRLLHQLPDDVLHFGVADDPGRYRPPGEVHIRWVRAAICRPALRRPRQIDSGPVPLGSHLLDELADHRLRGVELPRKEDRGPAHDLQVLGQSPVLGLESLNLGGLVGADAGACAGVDVGLHRPPPHGLFAQSQTAAHFTL